MPTSKSTEVNGTCALCDEQNRRLVDSHIIPKSFTAELGLSGGKQRAAFLLERGHLERSRRQGGVYQENFLCEECEQRLGRWDDYAGKIFIREINRWKKVVSSAIWTPENTEPNTLIEWTLDADAGQVLFFLASLLWRAHATTTAGFETFSLGAHAEQFKHMASRGVLPVDSSMFAVLLVRYLPSQRSPRIEQSIGMSGFGPVNGRNCCSINFRGWRAWIKIDPAPFAQGIEERKVKPGRDLVALSLPFDNTLAEADLRHFAKSVRQAEIAVSVQRASDRIAKAKNESKK